MKRSGPCRHCGVTCSPMWRKGPLEKAVLCNACGTRFRHRGHLNNYLPKQCKPHYYLNKLPDLSLKIWGKPLTNVANSVWGEEPLTNVENSYKGGRKGAGLWKYRIPTRKRSPRVCKRMFSMQRFQKQLLDEWVRQGKPMNDSSSEDVLLFNNVNNFIPTNEIGVGVMLLKLDGPSI